MTLLSDDAAFAAAHTEIVREDRERAPWSEREATRMRRIAFDRSRSLARMTHKAPRPDNVVSVVHADQPFPYDAILAAAVERGLGDEIDRLLRSHPPEDVARAMIRRADPRSNRPSADWSDVEAVGLD